MKRAAHIIAIVLAVAGAVLMALEQIPAVAVKYAAPLAVAVALNANLRTALKGAIDKGLVGLFVLLCVSQLFGCATVSGVAKTCAPATTDETQAIDELFARPDLTTAEVIFLAEGGKIAACVVTQIAQSIMTSAAQVHLSTTGGDSLMVTRAQAWVAKHP
jgi:hypothetical protein